MSFEELRKKLKHHKQDLIFNELFTDYKKFQIKKLRKAYHTEQKDYTKSQKTLSATKMDSIILRHQNRNSIDLCDSQPQEYKTLQRSHKSTANMTLKDSHFFKSQGREQLNQNRVQFKQNYSKQNPIISESFRSNYRRFKEKTLPTLNSQITKFQSDDQVKLQSSKIRLKQMNILKQRLEQYKSEKHHRRQLLKAAKLLQWISPAQQPCIQKRISNKINSFTISKQNIFPTTSAS